MASTDDPYPYLSYLLDKSYGRNFTIEISSKCSNTKDENGESSEIETCCRTMHLSSLPITLVVSYALQFSSNPKCGAEIQATLSSLHRIASTIMNNSSGFMDNHNIETNLQSFLEKTVGFMPDFRILFMVHKLKDWSDVVEVAPNIINFLIIILNPTGISDSVHKDQIASIQKELKFLLAFLGDTALLRHAKHLEEARDLLMKIGATARSVGAFIYDLFFGEDQVSIVSNMGDCISVELERMEDIKTDIRELCYTRLSHWLSCCPDQNAIESLFIVDSFIGDLENILTFQIDVVDGVADEILTIYEKMMFSLSTLNEIKLSVWEIREMKQLAIRIRDTAYEAEYLIKSFAMIEDASFTWYLNLRLPHVIQKLKFIETTITELKENYDIGALQISKDIIVNENITSQQTSTLDDDIVVGFDEKVIEVLDQLVSGSRHLQIISVCGMPGLGKTTFAKKLYNHRFVGDYFDKRSWIVVSQACQRKKLLIGILMNLDRSYDVDSKTKDENITEMIYKTLKGRKYLIVMDDIWDSNFWDDLRRYFPDDGNGSRIIFTSRNSDVVPLDSVIHTLPFLTEDQCWELLQKKIFGHKEGSNCPPKLEVIGRQITANCGRLPLEVVVIAGILANLDKDEIVWEKVKGSLDSYLFADPEKCMKTLELSYRYLPDHLKPCFLYFGMYSEDEEIEVSELMRLWNAEGFIPRKQLEKNPVETIARKFLIELIDRGLLLVVERSYNGGVKRCGIHDLLHELCLKIAKEVNFKTWIGRKDSIGRTGLPFSLHIRSILGDVGYSYLFLQNMKLIRLLKLPLKNYGDAEDIISLQLVQVRYLHVVLREADILNAINLVNLEYLIVDGVLVDEVSTASFLPFLLKMPKLRYLKFPDAYLMYDEDFDSSSKGAIIIRSLEHLVGVCIDASKGEEFSKSFPHLLKLKRCIWKPKISFGNDDDQVKHWRFPDIRLLTRLESLDVVLVDSGDDWGEKIVPRSIIELNFPSNIKKLTLHLFGLPWEKISSTIGKLPKLEVLKLDNYSFEEETWETKDDEFQELRVLKLSILNFKKWDVASNEHFPRLQRLMLWGCYKLLEIPSEIGEIPTLELIDVKGCSDSVVESALRIREEQLEMFGSTDLKIIIQSKRK